jgi:hypothetical protein
VATMQKCSSQPVSIIIRQNTNPPRVPIWSAVAISQQGQHQLLKGRAILRTKPF